MPAERVIRDALREVVLAQTHGARDAVDEFWVPLSHERADIAVIGRWMDGFEIKTERDTLRRLPRQALAYGRLFDRCTVVVAQRHRDQAAELLPDWWGITTVHVNGSVEFSPVRPPRRNPGVNPETLVRLLWREEAMAALQHFGRAPDPRATRGSMWRELLHATTLTELRSVVRRAVVSRDPARARIATRRFTSQAAAAAAAGVGS